MSTTFWIQFLGILFGVFMIYFSFLKFKKKEFNGLEFFVWIVAWAIFIVVSIIPTSLDPLINSLNFYRRLDFFVVIGFFMLLGLGFYNYGVVKKTQRRLESVVRRTALKEQNEQLSRNPSFQAKRQTSSGYPHKQRAFQARDCARDELSSRPYQRSLSLKGRISTEPSEQKENEKKK